MNYYDIKNLIKSFAGLYGEDKKSSEQNKGSAQICKPKIKYIPPGGFVSYRGTSVVSKPFKETVEEKITRTFSLAAQQEKDKLNREAITQINDISKLLLQEFEAGRLVYVEEKPKSIPILTKIKKLLKIK